jgi:c(7)-type cytochrome triheme protein
MRIFYLVAVLFVIFCSVVAAKTGGGDITFKEDKTGQVIFSHDAHVKDAGLKCTDCHDRLYVTREKSKRVTMAQIQKGKSCGACHNGKKAFDVKSDCGNCHKK